jgi:hypothetical protein
MPLPEQYGKNAGQHFGALMIIEVQSNHIPFSK